MVKSNLQMLQAEPGATTLSDGNTLTRCSLRNCAITTTSANRCSFEDCMLAQVDSANRSAGRKSHFHDAFSLSRSDFADSIIRDRSSVHRSTVKASTVRDASALKRSTVTGSTISNGRVERSALTDCDVEECAISRSEFNGMILKYGVWKKGQLVGKIKNKEPIMIRKDSPEAEVSVSFELMYMLKWH
ncbi:hypothetical protein N7448_004320 [Penicillium atrosanguineum]|uniref:Uncharacterized protein n=1 Tax=Penicillium atrosanguineum TaxID=1132637 RepID=A0A9W9H955_9EURO|nr:uncharacterized protein N7443_003284 [Penicillium atrosanguineum]KAJ5118033.1 hypothetical protein N7526_011056 [Penicillium atrosanguineum]KAJ5140912.1 hypothetical protein N7448_004320 [Penicillium atrosanguineum]KAJ5310823.1 hypothetical protein N7443_003284 [Penicillium atrosanguineum]KAJ5316348.1 hypothetical protein N7476_006655 [Penicillium atrosanguineum]